MNFIAASDRVKRGQKSGCSKLYRSQTSGNNIVWLNIFVCFSLHLCGSSFAQSFKPFIQCWFFEHPSSIVILKTN